METVYSLISLLTFSDLLMLIPTNPWCWLLGLFYLTWCWLQANHISKKRLQAKPPKSIYHLFFLFNFIVTSISFCPVITTAQGRLGDSWVNAVPHKKSMLGVWNFKPPTKKKVCIINHFHVLISQFNLIEMCKPPFFQF